MKRARWAMAWALGAALGVMAASPRAEEIDRVVATLDEEAIFLSEVEAHARPLLVESAAQPGTAEQRAERRRTILRQSLDRMLNDRLMRRAATRAHTTVTSEEVDEFIERLAAERGATPAQVYAALEAEGITRAEYRARMETEVLTLKVLQARVRGRINITEADLRQEYQRIIREAPQRAVWQVAHILVEVPESATDAERDAARGRAADAARRAQGGEDWAAVVRATSSDENTRESGGRARRGGPRHVARGARRGPRSARSGGRERPGARPERLPRAADAQPTGGAASALRAGAQPGAGDAPPAGDGAAPAYLSPRAAAQRLHRRSPRRPVMRAAGPGAAVSDGGRAGCYGWGRLC